MASLNKIQQSFSNMNSTNTEIKLEIPELPMGNGMVSKPPRPDILDNTSESGVIELPTSNHK